MNCLYCGKEIRENALDMEKKNAWHNRCVKSFFGTKTLPKLDLSEKQMEELANASVNKGLTVPGVQKKLSLHLSGGADARFTIVDYPTGYILKPQTEKYLFLPEFEDLAMRLAGTAGIRTVPYGLLKVNGEYAYITKRVDREISYKTENTPNRKRPEDMPCETAGSASVTLYAMEDFCQLSHRMTQDKYKGSYENCARIIKKYSAHRGLDLSELFLRIVFSYIIGNSDMHLKNFSLREMEPASRRFCLSEAYDMLPVSIILPEDKDQMALTLNGKKRNLRKKDFKIFAESCEISEKTADKMMEKLCSLKNHFLEQCDQSYLPEDLKEKGKELILQRIGNLS